MILKKTLPFLSDLARNNNKDWFTKNKAEYLEAYAEFKDFIDHLLSVLAKTDPLLAGVSSKECVFRIYRDVRFSKNKTPYKSHFGAYMAPGGRKSPFAGFYIHIEPEAMSFAGGGVFHPEPQALKALRNEFYSVPEELIEIMENADFKKYFNGLWEDDKLKLAPKGFPKDFKHIELLKYKSYIASHNIERKTIEQVDIIDHLANIHKAMYPLNRLLNTILEDAEIK